MQAGFRREGVEAASRFQGPASRPDGDVGPWTRGWPVLAALLPAAAAGAFHFGFPALSVMGGAAGACVALQALSARVLGGRQSLTAGRAALTGLVIGMSLPASSPAWLVLAGCTAAVLCAAGSRRVFGFDVHPAVVALALLLAVFPGTATAWTEPTGLFGSSSARTVLPPLVVVGADPAAALVGRVPGGSGSTSVLALAIGGLFLMLGGAGRWQAPCAFLAGLSAPAAAAAAAGAAIHPGLPAQLLGGDAALAAFFVAADPTASPRTPRGRLVYGAGCGLLTWLARTVGGLPEGVWYALLVMSICVPLIERVTDTGSNRAAG